MSSWMSSTTRSKPARSPLLNSLFVATRVMSANHDGFVTTDAGTKRFSMGGPAPRVSRRRPGRLRYGFQGDEHGKLMLPTGATRPVPGHLLELVVLPHCDPTVDKHDHYHVVDGDTLVDIWPIEGRGVLKTRAKRLEARRRDVNELTILAPPYLLR
ncbi:MAG: hypothetical protein R3E68_22315 [Burkholderiaceae bacterium]